MSLRWAGHHGLSCGPTTSAPRLAIDDVQLQELDHTYPQIHISSPHVVIQLLDHTCTCSVSRLLSVPIATFHTYQLPHLSNFMDVQCIVSHTCLIFDIHMCWYTSCSLPTRATRRRLSRHSHTSSLRLGLRVRPETLTLPETALRRFLPARFPNRFDFSAAILAAWPA